jgi:hypothetical protein
MKSLWNRQSPEAGAAIDRWVRGVKSWLELRSAVGKEIIDGLGTRMIQKACDRCDSSRESWAVLCRKNEACREESRKRRCGSVRFGAKKKTM